MYDSDGDICLKYSRGMADRRWLRHFGVRRLLKVARTLHTVQLNQFRISQDLEKYAGWAESL